MLRRRTFLGAAATLAAAMALGEGQAARAGPGGRRIIDVHMHAYPADQALETSPNPVSGRRSGARNGAEHLSACLAEMKRHNVVQGVVSGGDGDRLKAAIDWHDRDPDRFIAAAGVRGSPETPLPSLETLRAGFSTGRLKVLGELTSQYAGRSISDPLYAPYLALAEEFDVPVALHTGLMPPGTPFDPCCGGARMTLGNPGLVEEALVRHPRLRLNLMHLGSPYLEDTLAILSLYPNVNVDTGSNCWLTPRAQFHDDLHRLIDAGFSDRIMFGSDQMYWPDAIGMAIEGIDSATFLTAAQKQAIFHDNAVRFYRLAD